jgi:hypothetical protein
VQEEFEFIEEESEKAKRRRKTAKDERDDFRRELDKLGVAAVSRLKLSIDKYRHSDSDDSGTLAEKDYCAKYPVTKDHIINDDYMDVARRYGAGRYWFTLRMDNKIVRQWERQVNPAVTPSGPVIQSVNPSDPNSPQVIVQSNGDGQQQPYQPLSMKDMMKAQRESLKEEMEFRRLLMESYGILPNQQVSQESRSEEEILTSAILKQPEVIENVVGSVMKRFGSKSGSGDDEPWYADIVRNAVKSGQAAQIVQVAIDRVFNGFGNLFPGRQNNGTPQMEPQTVSPMPNQRTGESQAPQAALPANAEGQGNAMVQEGMGSVQGIQAQGDPYTQMLTSVITTLANNGPVEDAIKRLDGFLLLYPAYNETIDNQFSQPADDLLGAISTIPGCEEIAKAEHAKTWIENFQKTFFAESQEGEEE